MAADSDDPAVGRNQDFPNGASSCGCQFIPRFTSLRIRKTLLLSHFNKYLLGIHYGPDTIPDSKRK